MSTASPPTHGRGTASEQGARIRAQMEENRKSQQIQPEQKIDKRSSKPVKQEKPKIEKPPKEEKPKETKTLKQDKPAPKATQKEEVNEKSAATTAAATPAVKRSESGSQPVYEKRGRCFPVTGIDNLALLMEGDDYQTTCFSVYLFKTELDSETLYKFFRKLVAWYPKYHYAVELSPSVASKKEKQFKKNGGEPVHEESTETDKCGRRTRYSKTLKAGGYFRPARWRYADTFKVEDNIVEMNNPPQGTDDDALHTIAGQFLSEHFDYSKPLWKALCVRGLNTSKGAKSALMIKVHHALSDGQGMIMSYHTALSALETDAKIEEVQAQVDIRSKKGEQKKPGQRNVHPTLWGTTKHGWHTVRGLYFRSRKAFDYPGSKRNPDRFYCHSDGIPMQDIKLVRDAFSDAGLDLTLNDVACAVLSRALRMAAERTEPGPVKDKRVAVFVPISKRPTGNWELTNFTTGAIAWFAFNDPKKVPFKEQLSQVHREMNRIKRSHWPHIWFNLFSSISKRRSWYAPNYPIGKGIFDLTVREYHVATNLPGPSKPIKFGTHEAFAYHVLPPSSPGKSSLAIGMISYANNFSLAVSCDGAKELKQRRLAEEICKAFQDASQELVQAAEAEKEAVNNGNTSNNKKK
ncbi:uncharacterized protein FA14DRAFT_162704 [Meira miltonrushii]|uniref:Uncharacterized protein n=1 Tax=Meira miltonrushii TaxID=1280837 RepID=A0A316V8R6_9BASI|nr:uncharacterized protein FA14DRAFT_162704 [Meira miltonrushii]PWN31855.1 hypothetical protein FA14DRAFT_162704 [Meira miltonrushii]